MGRLGVLYHMDTCIACGACQTACKDGHGLIGGEFFRRVEMIETDEGYLPYSGACCHCGNPMCVSACPTGEMHKTEEGAVVHDDGLCIGCGACVWNCPYGAVSFSRLKGVSQKCDSCIERRQKGENPLCVDACPTDSLKYGEWDDLLKDFGQEMLTPDFLPSPKITEPSLLILGGKKHV